MCFFIRFSIENSVRCTVRQFNFKQIKTCDFVKNMVLKWMLRNEEEEKEGVSFIVSNIDSSDLISNIFEDCNTL